MNRIAIALAAATAAFMSSSTFGADLYSAQPIAYQASSSWTGFYAGVFAGIGAGDSVFTAAAPPTVEVTNRGGLAGIQVGADYQFDSFVVGAVADIAATNIEGRFSIGGFPEMSSKLNYLGTVRARAGFLPTENVLVYAHGGLAFGRTTPSYSAGGVPLPGLISADHVGYSVGAGLEYKVTDHITVQAEYAYTDLGSKAVSDPAVFLTSLDENLKFHSLKAGLNYRF